MACRQRIFECIAVFLLPTLIASAMLVCDMNLMQKKGSCPFGLHACLGGLRVLTGGQEH